MNASTSPFDWTPHRIDVSAAAPVHAAVSVPGSKSLTNRLLLLAALARGESRLHAPLDSEDTRLMAKALAQMGADIHFTDEAWIVRSNGRLHEPKQAVYVGNAGTVMRFLAPLLCTFSTPTELTCSPRMTQRPIGDLGGALEQLGGRLDYLNHTGYPPMRVAGPLHGGHVQVPGARSSQYLSGLLMTLPGLSQDSRITLTSPLVSQTYVEMTLWCLAQAGVMVRSDPSGHTFLVPGRQTYGQLDVRVEPDASTASYWWALPLMVGGQIEMPDVSPDSTQGDAGLLRVFQEMGAAVIREPGKLTVKYAPLRGVDVDMNTMSDVAPTLAVVATRANSPTTITNVGHMRIKECDRIATLQRAFDQLGLPMESGPDWMRITPAKPQQSAVLDPQDDHRMAMVFTLLGLAYGNVGVLQPQCVAKTYPDFYQAMQSAVTQRPK